MTEQVSKASRAAVLLNRHQDEIAAVWTEMAITLPEGQLTEQTLPRPSSGCTASREGFDPWDEFRLLTSEDSGCIMPLWSDRTETRLPIKVSDTRAKIRRRSNPGGAPH
jgi:hypothetical protein